MLDVSQIEKENLKDNFFQLMMEFPYLKEAEKKRALLQKALTFAEKIPEFKGWPHEGVAFWNAESFMWQTKIDKDIRQAIRHELLFRIGVKNLDLGSGNLVYTPNTTSLDYSPEMLALNDNKNKVLHNLEQPLPFENESFDSVTGVFILSYIQNVVGLLQEMNRVLKVGGKLTLVQGSVNDLYYLHLKNNYSEPELRILLKKSGFKADSFTKEINRKKITFFFCEKKLK